MDSDFIADENGEIEIIIKVKTNSNGKIHLSKIIDALEGEDDNELGTDISIEITKGNKG